ncbi:enolase-phosphatase E1-like isoform X2 [Mytilus edulis]|uniref:enolase-phosphatase E1-like isoform X2 n=1 Tax=Mytilus edulis TaxID=6550 RepID=UPI0039EE2FD4
MVLDDSIYATVIDANELQPGNTRTNREISEDEKNNNIPDNISNSPCVVTGSNLLQSCESTTQYLDYESESDDETYFDCKDETPVSTVDKYTGLTKESDANENELVVYKRQDSKLKGDDDTSEQDHNFDSDFVYDEVDSNTEVIKEQNEDINSSDTEHINDEVQRSKGTDADKYDTIFDLQHFEKRDVIIGYVLDVTEIETSEISNPTIYYTNTKANNEIHAEYSKGNTDDKKEVVDIQEKEHGFIGMDDKKAVDDYPVKKEAENAADESQENKHDIYCKNAVDESEGKDNERVGNKAANKIRRQAANMFDESCERLEEEDAIVCELHFVIQDDNDDGEMVVGEILREADAIVGKREDVEISENDDEIDFESGVVTEKGYYNEIVDEMSADGMNAVEDEIYDKETVEETQKNEIQDKHGDMDSIKEVCDFIKLNEEIIGRIQGCTDAIDVEEVDSKIVNIIKGEEVKSENVGENAASTCKQVVVEILEADADIYDTKAMKGINNKKDVIVFQKAMNEVRAANDKNQKGSNEYDNDKEDFSSTDKNIKGNTFCHLEDISTQPSQKTWFTTRDWKFLKALLILLCSIPFTRGANNAIPRKVTWSLQTNPVVFGSNATLCCIVQGPETKHMAWVRDPEAIVLATGNSTLNPMKYSASIEPKGNCTYYLLTIFKIDMTDININYKCESNFDLFEQKLELREESFVMKPLRNETVTNITRENGMISVSLRIQNIYPKPECFFSSKRAKINGNISLEENGKLYNVKMAFGISEHMCEDNITAYCALGKEIEPIYFPSSNNSWTRQCPKDRHGDNSVLIVTVVIIITLLFIVVLIGLLVKKYFARKVGHAFKRVLNPNNHEAVLV